MPNIALLNNIEHKDLRIITGHRPGLGSDVAWAPTFGAEFRSLQGHYPIIFRQTDDAQRYEAIALLGFLEDENLFLDDGRWDAHTVPMLLERQPFLIGRSGDELMVQIDLDNPRVSKTEGQPIFKEHGGSSEYLEHINDVLSTIHRGVQANVGFIEALMRHQLLEGFTFDLTLDDGSQNRLAGFFTIAEERLAGLDAAIVAELHKAGYLEQIYYAMASLSNFRVLVDRKNKHDAARR
ncbi:SapC family protein [Massilia sp.]|uniref:SapC family protein n=1 Tax=Massilia sp. TaxID=1882437 RepID=UPI00289E63FC|nr:SapC family protein [Massilia sp.]